MYTYNLIAHVRIHAIFDGKDKAMVVKYKYKQIEARSLEDAKEIFDNMDVIEEVSANLLKVSNFIGFKLEKREVVCTGPAALVKHTEKLYM